MRRMRYEEAAEYFICNNAGRILSLDGENIVLLQDQSELGRIPLHNLEGIVCFGYKGVSLL